MSKRRKAEEKIPANLSRKEQYRLFVETEKTVGSRYTPDGVEITYIPKLVEHVENRVRQVVRDQSRQRTIAEFENLERHLDAMEKSTPTRPTTSVNAGEVEPPMQKVPAIEVAPGFGLTAFLGRFCQKNFREFQLTECHSNALVDYQEQLAAGNYREAKYVRRMMPVWLFACMVGGALAWVGSRFTVKFGGASSSGD